MNSIYKIGNGNFKLKERLSESEQGEAMLLLNLFLSMKKANSYSQQFFNRVENFYKIILQCADGKSVPDDFSIMKATLPTAEKIIIDFCRSGLIEPREVDIEDFLWVMRN